MYSDSYYSVLILIVLPGINNIYCSARPRWLGRWSACLYFVGSSLTECMLEGNFSCLKKNDERKARERELSTFDEN